MLKGVTVRGVSCTFQRRATHQSLLGYLIWSCSIINLVIECSAQVLLFWNILCIILKLRFKRVLLFKVG